ncbi:MAG TPA: GntR family transcriptional regulator [Planctomycetota bacterium]|nr:GntR family transcriptional regulator [Planctomycetota bacterium]
MQIEKEVLRDKIGDVLRGWILDGKLKPGERIVELTLARELNVSRAPFREALWGLARQGLVEIRAHHGAHVTQLSEQDIREIFEIRELLEIHAAKKIRATADAGAKAALRQALAELEDACRRRDIKLFSAADLRFHKTLWELAGNRHLQHILNDVSTRFFGYELIRDLPHSGKFRFDVMAEEHRRMVKLILEGSDRGIEAGFRKIFAGFLDYVLVRFAETPPPARRAAE